MSNSDLRNVLAKLQSTLLAWHEQYAPDLGALIEPAAGLAAALGFTRPPVRIERCCDAQIWIITHPFAQTGLNWATFREIEQPSADNAGCMIVECAAFAPADAVRSAFALWLDALADPPVQQMLRSDDYRVKYGIAPNTLAKARRDGRIHGERHGGRWFYVVDDVKRQWPDAFTDQKQD
jgi:hypothetical protein